MSESQTECGGASHSDYYSLIALRLPLPSHCPPTALPLEPLPKTKKAGARRPAAPAPIPAPPTLAYGASAVIDVVSFTGTPSDRTAGLNLTSASIAWIFLL